MGNASSQALIDETIRDAETFKKTNDESTRQKLIATANALILALETPGDTLARIGWGEPSRNAAIRVAMDLGLFAKLDATGKRSAQLAEGTGADVNLISRTMKHLAATGIVEEAGKDLYRSTSFSSTMNVPAIRDGIVYSFEGMAQSFQGLPPFLAETKYQVPTDPANGPLQYGHKTSLPFFGLLQDKPRLGQAFNNFMSGYAQARPRWMGYYPVVERLGGEHLDGKGTLLVDVGGGLGHDIAEFHAKHPELPGRLILQDQEWVIGQVKSASEPPPSAITPTVHDFFTPQPVTGARAYYLHLVLHDWSDERSTIILGHLRDAMKKRYSKILLNENVVPDVGANWQKTSLDWTMMGMLATRERTESQWRGLLEGAGLKVTGIWNKDSGSESIIEAVRGDE